MHTRFPAAVHKYSQHLDATSLERNSMKNRMQILNHALPLWGNVYTHRITGTEVDALFAAGDWSPRTRNLYLSNLRVFCEWARNERIAPRSWDPTASYTNRRVPRTDKQRVPMSQFSQLLDACKHPRDRAVVACGLYLFLRGSELQTLQIQDVNFSDATVSIYRHKTHDEDTLPMCEELRDELTRWLAWYRQDQGGLHDDWYLLPSKRSNHFTWVDGVRVQVSNTPPLRPDKIMSHPYRPAKRALAELGIDAKGEGEHTLRRSGARAWFDVLRDQGHSGALMRVSSMLGHSDTRITEHYIGVSQERAQRNIILSGNRMFPEADQSNLSHGLRMVR